MTHETIVKQENGIYSVIASTTGGVQRYECANHDQAVQLAELLRKPARPRQTTPARAAPKSWLSRTLNFLR